MRERISDYPALQKEDDGFLKHLKLSIIDPLQESWGFAESDDFSARCVQVLEASQSVHGKGACLPFRVPIKDEQGQVVISDLQTVWSGKAFDFPLYPGEARQQVESLIFDDRLMHRGPSKAFAELPPAFQVALLVHYMEEYVVLPVLAAEAFVLGAFGETPLADQHYLDTGLPTTQLALALPVPGPRVVWIRESPTELSGTFGDSRYSGWTVRIRGARPKEAILRDCWQDMRAGFCGENASEYHVSGRVVTSLGYSEAGKRLERSPSPKIDCMVQWVDALALVGKFPMCGDRADWKSAHAQFEIEVPELAGHWTADSMRRAYKKRTGHKVQDIFE